MPNLHPQIVQVLDAMEKAQLRPIEAMIPPRLAPRWR